MTANNEPMLDLSEITDEEESNVVDIGLFGDDLNFDLDIDSLVQEDVEELSLISESLTKAKENNDQHLTLAMLMQLDPSTGKSSKGIEIDLTNIILDTDFEDEEEYVKEVTVPRDFDKNELEKYRQLLIEIKVFKESKKIESSVKNEIKELDALTSIINKYNSDKRKLIRKLESEKPIIERLGNVIKLMNARANKMKLNKQQLQMIEQLDAKEVVSAFKTKAKEVKYIEEQIEKINKLLQQKENEKISLFKRIKERKEIKRNDILTKAKNEVNEIMSNVKKVVAVQFGFHLYSEDFKERPIAVMCSCGHKSIHTIGAMPYYMSGDIYGDFRERSYINKKVKKNYFANKDTIKVNETRYKLEGDGNIEGRINFPSLTDNSNEALKCEGCKSYLLFPPEVIEKLISRGVVSDTLMNELLHTSIGKHLSRHSSGVKIYLSPNEVSKNYQLDLGLAEYKTSKLLKISKDINIRDDKNLVTRNRIDEYSLRQYVGKMSGDVDLEQVENELYGHIKNIEIAINEMIKQYIKKPIKEGTTGRTLENQLRKNKRNGEISSFLKNSKSIIMKYAIDRRMSSQALKNEVKYYENNIQAFKYKLLDFLVDYLIDSVIDGRPTFVFEEGYLRVIKNSTVKLPHINFFKCYRPIIKQFYLTEIIKIDKDYELVEHYELFRALSNISNITDYDLRVRKSEEYIKILRTKLGEIYEQNKERLLLNYIQKPLEFEDNLDESGRCFAWLYYEMLTQYKVMKNTEVQNTDLFEELYGDELRSKGYFFMFNPSKNEQ